MRSIGLLALGLLVAACADRGDENPAVQAQTDSVADTLDASDLTPRIGLPQPTDTSVRAGEIAPGEGTQVNIEIGDGTMKMSTQTVPAGQVTFQVQNTGKQTHRFESRWAYGATIRTQPVAPQKFTLVTSIMNQGPYEAFCSVEGHRDRGEYIKFEVK